jgi:exonuclease SbcD
MTMECVELDTLGTGYDYLALGHIHRPQQLSERARYCGTPVPVSFDEQCEHSVSIVEIDNHEAVPRIITQRIKNLNPLHTLPADAPVSFEDALKLLQQFDADERAYIRLNVQVDRFLPAGALERAALAVKDKQCRFCDIKRTVTATGSRVATQMTLEEFNQMTPIEVAQRYFMDKNNAAMSEAQQEMFNMIYQAVKEENRQ